MDPDGVGDRPHEDDGEGVPELTRLVQVVDAMERIPMIRDPYGRQLLADLVRECMPGISVGDHPVARKFFLNIVDACRREPEGLIVLARALNQLQPNSQSVRAVVDLLAELGVLDPISPVELGVLRSLLVGLESHAVFEAQLAAAGASIRAQRPASADAWGVYQDLTKLNAGPDGLPPSLVFVERLAPSLDRDRAEQLHGWTDRQAALLNLERELRRVRQEITGWNPIDLRTAYLVIQFAPYGHKPGQYLLSHWHQLDPAGWSPRRGKDQIVTLNEAELRVEELVKAAETEWTWFDGQIIVEFLLPRQLLPVTVEGWVTESNSDQPIPLHIRYPVFLRSLERMRKREWHRVWRQRWKRLRDNPGDADTHWCRPDGEGYPARLEKKLMADPRLASMVLSAPPVEPQGQSSVDEVLVGLRSGLPLMVWHRVDCDLHVFHQVVIDLLSGSLTELPERTRTLRRQGVEAMAQELEHVVVLLDSPDRLLESDQLPGIAS